MRKKVFLATMNCKLEDSSCVAKFWHVFNESCKEANSTSKIFSPCGWVTDMSPVNFNGLAIITGEYSGHLQITKKN